MLFRSAPYRPRVNPIRVTVWNEGSFRPLPRQQAMAFVEGRFKVPGPFILCVGDLQPRKNQIGLIHAFEELLCAHPDLPHQLILWAKKPGLPLTFTRLPRSL